MIYGKLTDGVLSYAPRPLNIDGRDVFTTDEGVYLLQGYKPLIYTDYPSDGYSYTALWAETDNSIMQTWTLAQSPMPSPDERIEALESAVLEMAEVIYGG